MTELVIWDARVRADRDAWIALYDAWPDREVFAHPAYVALFATPTERPLAAFARFGDGWVLYPFILRPLEDGEADLTTPYGYGGPFRHGNADAPAFWAAFDAWAASQRVVSEFVRLSLFPEQRLAYPGQTEVKLQNVVCSLLPDEDALWSGFDHKVRKNVNKAKRSGVTIEIDTGPERLDEFLRIYETTMDRREARKSYYFSRAFFETIASALQGGYAFLHALVGGRIVSTELALVSAHNVYSFLGGTEEAAFDLRPNDLLKYELIRWAKREGRSRFVLGGGYAPDDGIFKYKRAFAPNGLYPFEVGTRVLDRAAYDELVERRRAADAAWSPLPGFFPAYRA